MLGLFAWSIVVSAVSPFIESSSVPYTLDAPSLTFVIPNEIHPRDAIPIWSQTQPGVYISVGTERAFIGAAMSAATSLAIADRDNSVLQYALINRALLTLAKDRLDYRHLRLYANWWEWHDRAMDALAEYPWVHVITKSDLWAWWASNIREVKGNSSLVRNAWQYAYPSLHGEGGEYSDEAFHKVNYLRDDRLFSKLQQMARTGKIAIRRLEWGHSEARKDLIRDLEFSGERLSVLDLSNAWWDRYLFDRKSLLEDIAGIAKGQPLLMITHHGHTNESTTARVFSPVEWVYLGLPLTVDLVKPILYFMNSRRFFRRGAIQTLPKRRSNRVVSARELNRYFCRVAIHLGRAH